MKSYSDDLPNVAKEEIELATNTAREAVHISKETLASSVEHTEVSQGNRNLLRGAIFLGILNLAASIGIIILLAQHILG